MSMRRAIVVILTVCFVVVLLLGLWIRQRRWELGVEPPATQPPQPSPTATPTTAVTPVATVETGHRLAGTVVGDVTYVIIEDPNGTSELYRPGQTIPGLGRVVDIGPSHVTIEGTSGRFRLELAPAPTATTTPLSTPGPDSASDEDVTPKHQPPLDQPLSGSSS